MDKNKFWDLIASVNAQVDVDDKESVLKATREALCELSSEEIVEWYSVYRELHHAAYRDDLWDAVEACGIHATDDGFIDFRAWLISRGQAVYDAVVAHPGVLGAYVSDPQEADFELYGYVSSDAYAVKVCKETLGDEGFEVFKEEWLQQHGEAIEENAEWNGLSPEVAGERLFHNALLMKHDIYEVLEKTSLQEKLVEAEERSAEVKEKEREEEKGLF